MLNYLKKVVAKEVPTTQKRQNQKNIVELQDPRSKVDHEQKRHTLNEKKRKLLTQAEQMKLPNNTTEIPVTMAYVFQKRKEKKFQFSRKKLQMKILIAMPLYERANKALEL